MSPFLPNILLEHKLGRVNKVADALSRASVLTSKGDTSTVKVLRVETQEVEPLLTMIRHQKCEERDLTKIILYLEQKQLPEEPGELKKIVTQCQKGYYFLDGVLYFENSDASSQRRIVVPEKLKQEVLSENHKAVFAGHFSPKRMFDKLSQCYYWQGICEDIQKVCETCVVCASTQGQERRKRSRFYIVSLWVNHSNVWE